MDSTHVSLDKLCVVEEKCNPGVCLKEGKPEIFILQ